MRGSRVLRDRGDLGERVVRRSVALVAPALALALLGAGFASASAATTAPAAAWSIESFAAPSDFSAGDDAQCEGNLELCDSYTMTARNAGSVATNGAPVTLTDALPGGLGLVKVEFFSEMPGQEREELDSDCTTGVPLRCTFTGAVAPDQTLKMIVLVDVGEGVSGPLTSVASVSGGGAAEMSTSTETPVGTATPPFGAVSFDADLAGVDGGVDTQGGGHPYELTATIDLNNVSRAANGGNYTDASVQDVKDLVIEPPLGFLASALAAPTCTLARLATEASCPPDTAVGYIRTEPEGSESLNTELYNLVPEHGFPAEFGYTDALHGAHVLYASVAPTPAGYVLRVTARELPQIALTALAVTLYGDPTVKDGNDNPQPPLLTNPSACSGQPLVTSVYMDSWQDPGEWVEDGRVLTAPTGPQAAPLLTSPGWVQASSASPAVTGCDELQFTPQLSAQPTTNMADSPSGLELELRSPQSESAEAGATPPLRSAVVTLPEGMTVDPAAGDGLQACSIAQIGWLGGGPENFDAAPPECPEASKIGSLELTTGLFAGVLDGALYLAAQDENPFGSALAAYLVVDDPVTGVLLKIPGELRADPRTGRLTVVLAENPQLPFSDLKLHFFGGPRALLATPDGCGAYTTTSELTPWSAPESGPAGTPFDSFTIDEGCGGGGFAPSFIAGATNLQAGAYSPLEVSFSREDAEGELSGWSVSLPPGLLADVGSVPLCPEAAANAGTCSEASRVGTVLAGAGPGPNPLFETGRAYLTGPYNGGPYGLSIVVPVIAGPLNLGSVVVRQSLRIDPSDARITDVSDPFPTIIDVTGANGQTDGIPIRLRRVDVDLDRPGFMFNPTDCAKLPLTGTISSAQGASAAVSSPFQVTDCHSLKFTPKLTALTRANGEFTGHGASLHIVIATAAGDTSAGQADDAATGQANIRSLKVDLPQRLPARLETIRDACPESTFDANPAACPKASAIGTAAVQTPILAGTMAGPAYLVSKSGTAASHPGESAAAKEEAAFPDLVLVLQGEGVRIDLTGTLFVSQKNITSVTFRTIPDVPIRRLDLILPEGPRSILAASASLCTKKPLSMSTAITAQDGARLKPTVKVGVEGCKKKKPKRHKKKRETKKRP